MGVSSLYQVETTINRYNTIAYNWGDSSHPETYQSFVTTGKGLIDQSIFSFQRRKDAWSLGAYCTSLAAGADASQITMEKHKSTLSKNNAFVLNNTISARNQNGKEINDGFKYSPDPTLSGWAPWINFEYNKTRIYPTFYMIDPTGVTYGPWNYNEVVEHNATTWQCWACFYEITGSVNSSFNIMNCQYAGQVREQVITSLGWDRYNVTLGDVEEGVYYYINGGNQLFQGLTFLIDGNVVSGGPATKTLTAFFDFTQMQWEMVRMSAQSAYIFTISFADVVKMIESLGFYWCKDHDALSSEGGINCTDPDLCCPIIDPETHMVSETVLSGTDIADYAEAHIDDPYCNFLLDSGNTDENDNPIGITTEEYRETYYPEQSTVEETETIELYPPTVSTTGGNTIWLMSETDVKNFFTYLWDPTGSEVQNILHGLALLGENPMDFIVSLRMFPLKNLYGLTTHALATICFGRYTSQLTNQAYLTSSNIIIVDLGEFYFNDGGLKNDFRDYEPYTRYSLFIPFCGITSLNAIECINQTIDVKMIIDLATGACTAVVYTDGVPYKYIDSNIGLEIPVVGRDMAGYAQTVMAAALGGGIGGGKLAEKPVKGQLERQNLAKDYQQISYDAKMWDVGDSFGATASAAGGTAVALGAAAVVGGALISGTVAALANAPAIDKAGSSVPAVALAEPLYCYFIVQRSDCWIPKNYEKLYGRPLNEGGKVGDYAGFSTFGNLKLDGISGATPEEKLLINDLLQAGIYI